MKRLKAGLLTLLASTLLLGAMGAGSKAAATPVKFYLQLVDENQNALGAVGISRVLTTGTKTDATVYTDLTLGTSKTNPLTMDANGEVSWFGDSATTYDLLVSIYSGDFKGSLFPVTGITATSSKRVQAARPGTERTLMCPVSSTTAATMTCTQTVPAGARVTDIQYESVTVTSAGGNPKMLVGNSNIGVQGYCASTNLTIGAIGNFFRCASVVAPTDANGLIHGTTAFAVTYTTQGHTATGYLFVKYEPTVF